MSQREKVREDGFEQRRPIIAQESTRFCSEIAVLNDGHAEDKAETFQTFVTSLNGLDVL